MEQKDLLSQVAKSMRFGYETTMHLRSLKYPKDIPLSPYNLQLSY